MVGGRGELAERERLRRDGLPQRRFVGGRLVRAVRCVARNQMAPALALYLRHLDGSEIDWGKKSKLRALSLTTTGLGRRRGCWGGRGRGRRGVRGGRLHRRGRRHVGRRGRRRLRSLALAVLLALSAAEARKAAHLAFPSAPPRGCDVVGARRAGGRATTRSGQHRNAGHAPSRRPPSPRAEHAPASQHRRGVSNSWNAMHRPWPCPKLIEPDWAGVERMGWRRGGGGGFARSGGRRAGRDHQVRRVGGGGGGNGNGRKALEIEGSKGLPREKGDRGRRPPMEGKRGEGAG